MVGVGDQVDDGRPQQWIDCHFSKLDDLSRHVPYMSAVGNHELYDISQYIKLFPTYNEIAYKGIAGEDDNRYYAFNVARILFLTMDSNLKVQRQIDWLSRCIDEQKMHVETWSTGNKDTDWPEQRKIDEFWRDLKLDRPEKSTIEKVEASDYPIIITGSAYSGDDDYNSTWFQLASSEDGFDNPEYELKRDYENLYGAKDNGPQWEPNDLNKGKSTIRLNNISKGIYVVSIIGKDGIKNSLINKN